MSSEDDGTHQENADKENINSPNTKTTASKHSQHSNLRKKRHSEFTDIIEEEEAHPSSQPGQELVRAEKSPDIRSPSNRRSGMICTLYRRVHFNALRTMRKQYSAVF